MMLFFLLLVGHALADYPLQGPFIGQFKNRHATRGDAFNGNAFVPWWHLMTAHALIHGGFVAVLTHSLGLGLAEVVLHWLIDAAKCEGWTGINTDQALHIGCKLLWVALVIAYGAIP